MIQRYKPGLKMAIRLSFCGLFAVAKASFWALAFAWLMVLPSIAQPSVNINPTNQLVYTGSNASFTAIVTGDGPFSYQWQWNGTNLPNAIVTTVAGNGIAGYSGDGGLANFASINDPWGVIVDTAGNLFFSENGNSRVRKVDTNGVISTVAGTGTYGFSGDGGAATNAQLSDPAFLALDAAGNLYIADHVNARVRKVDTNGIIMTIAGGGTNLSDGIEATNAELYPSGLAFDRSGNLYIADLGNGLVRKVDNSGIITTAASGGQVAQPLELAFDPSGNLYIADPGDNVVLALATNGNLGVFAGGGVSGTRFGGPATNAGLNYPFGTAVDGASDVFITEFNSESISMVDTNGIITTVAGNGIAGYSGDNGDATNASFWNPSGIALDTNGDIFVSDSANNVVREVVVAGPVLKFSNVTTNLSGNYTVVVSNALGVVTSAVSVLTVVQPAIIVTPPSSIQSFVSSNVSFTVVAEGTPPLSYQWQLDGANLSGDTNSALAVGPLLTNDAGNYTIVVSNAYGCVTSAPAILKVTAIPPTIGIQPMSQVVPMGSNVTFSATAAGSPPLSYQWWLNSGALSGQTNESLSLSGVSTNDAGSYTLVVTNPYGVATSHVAGLLVGTLPYFSAQPSAQSAVLQGNSTVISAAVTGLGPLTFQWQLNGSNLADNLTVTLAGNGGNGYSGDHGLATQAAMARPECVIQDSSGNLYITDSGNSLIRKVDTIGIITTVAGKYGPGIFSGDGGPATNAGLSFPNGITLDASGRMFIADTENSRIRMVDSNGIISTVAGHGLFGSFGGDGGQATNAGLNQPFRVAFDGYGNMFIADYGNNRVRKVATNGIITTVAGNGKNIFSGDGGPATNASVYSPGDLAFDVAGNLYVAETIGNRIRKVDTNGLIWTVAGNGSYLFSGDNGPATNAALVPYGIALDPYGNILVADYQNNRIRQIDAFGIITTIAGTSHQGFSGDGQPPAQATFSMPQSVAFDSLGRVLVSDTQDSRVRRFGIGPSLPLTAVTASNAGSYTLVVTSQFGSITSAPCSLTVLIPPQLETRLANDFTALDETAVFSVTATGTQPLAFQWQFDGTNLVDQTSEVLSITNAQWADAGIYTVLVTNAYGTASEAATLTVGNPPMITNAPTAITVAPGQTAVLSVGVAGDGPFTYQWQFNGTNLPPIITTIGGNGDTNYSGDGGAATNAGMVLPNAVACDAKGNVYVTDYGENRIRRIDTNGIITTYAGTGNSGLSPNGTLATNASFLTLRGLCVDAAGNVFVGEYNPGEVQKIDTNGIVTKVAGTGSSVRTADGLSATNTSFDGIWGVAVDSLGDLFVTDVNSWRVRKVGTNGIVSTVAGNGTNGFSGDGGPATNAKLMHPLNVAVDSLGNIFVADDEVARIRKVDTDGIITTVAGGGTNYTGDDGIPATNAALNTIGIALDATGNLFITESTTGRVRKVDANGILSTVAGTGVPGFSGDGGYATEATLKNPQSTTIDPLGNLIIADTGNNRVRKVHLAGDPFLTLSSLTASNSGTYSVVITCPFGSTTSSNITLTVGIPPTPPPMAALQVNGDGTVSLLVSATTNTSSRVFATTNLAFPDWVPIYTNPAGGVWTFTDSNAFAYPGRFFKLSTP
ncbi:MAG TPA: immunoglobulin domain-containing protein [Verrucomicrobiae bacterium]